MNFYKWYKNFLFLSILCVGLSVSLSQLFLALSFLLFVLTPGRKADKFSSLLWVCLSIFFLYLFSIILQLFSGDSSYLQRIASSEFKDIFLFLAFLVFSKIKTEDFEHFYRAFWFLFLILLVTGFLSIFTPVRFSRLINDWFSPSGLWRLTHHYGNVGPVRIHLPIGLMNTHLTFGGQIMLLFPLIFFRVFLAYYANGFFAARTKKLSLLLLIFLLVILLNNARSAMLGMVVAVAIGLFDLRMIKKQVSPAFVSKTIFIPLITMVVILAALFSNPATRKTVRPLFGSEKHTDSGRTFIWSSTFPMIKNHPILGIGPGNYKLQVEKTRKTLSEKYKELLFFYEVTQRGHSHNDILHIAAIAGIPAALVFIALCGFILRAIFSLNHYRDYAILFYGLVGFFFAGSLQCYFQDDEVVILFWLLLGFLNRLYMQEKMEMS